MSMTTTLPRQLERVRFAKGDKIFREGEPGSCAYLIESGSVEISAMNHGAKIVISTLGPGEIFGEMALIDNRKRSATATILEDTDMIALDRTQFENKIAAADPVLHMLLRVILKRFRWALQKALSNERMHMTGDVGSSGQTVIFDSAQSEAIQKIRMEQDLGEGIRHEQFTVHYQPILSTGNLRIAGFEALIRWNHPERGLLLPGEFIGAAEDSQQIIPIGEWVLNKACGDLATLQAAQPPGATRFFMTINVSSVQIRHLAHKQRLTKAIENAGILAEDIKLEFTESVLIESPELAAQALSDIKQAGVHFAIDDFGTGYSSLSYLQRFPLDVLKIDRSFVTDLATNNDSRQIVKAIMGLTKGLSLEVVAEGIESADTLALLIELGCDYVQGFMLSRPIELDDALVLVRADKDYLNCIQPPPAAVRAL